jgi:hypothetical protein
VVEQNIHWEPVDAEKTVWTAKYRCPGFIAHTSAFAAKDGQLILYSPGASLVSRLPEGIPDAQLPPLALLPNAFHYLGLKAWKEKYPGMTAVASSRAMSRLRKKGVSGLQDLDLLKNKLPDNVSILEPPGIRFGEMWLRVSGSGGVAWIVCDAFFNYARFSKKPIARTIQKLFKAAPGLKISFLVKRFMIVDRKKYKDWLFERLEADRPNTLVPAHGEILRAPDLPQRIRDLVQQRL